MENRSLRRGQESQFFAPAISWTTGRRVIGAAKAQGVVPTFIAPQAKVPMIATKDIGRIGAEQSDRRWTGKQIVEMAGRQNTVRMRSLQRSAEILGKTVRAQRDPLSAVAPTFKSFGFSDEAGKLFEKECTARFQRARSDTSKPDKLVRG